MNYKIKEFKPIEKNTLRGFFTLVFGPVEIADMTFHQKNDKQWVNFPSRPYQDKETGETKYASIIKIPSRESYWGFQRWCVSELKQYLTIEHKPISESDNDIPF